MVRVSRSGIMRYTVIPLPNEFNIQNPLNATIIYSREISPGQLNPDCNEHLVHHEIAVRVEFPSKNASGDAHDVRRPCSRMLLLEWII